MQAGFFVEILPLKTQVLLYLVARITLKGHKLKAAGFETGFTFMVKILNGCWVLIPDHEDIRAIK
ncbi:hypothetical protein [Providencia stuartii]|uniref:hypothetical protein n=1 Tax=Providencia stuartii TaxID=588 RepID=UPI000689BE3D|nr:hypothetical protein [Providencia stuartii]